MQGWLQTSRRLAAAVRALSRRHWASLLRLRGQLRFSEETVHLLLGGVVGVLGGLVNLLFYTLTDFFKELVLRHRGDWTEIARSLPWWQCLLTPAVGGLAAGLVLYWALRTVGLPGASNLLEVVVVGDGRLRFRTGLLKALSSLLTISSGGSIGREGPIIHVSATLASKFGQVAKWPPYRLRLLVACGAAAGLAAAYNAPLAGAVFAAQIVLGNFSMHLFAPLVVASVVASVLSRSFFGIAPWYQVPVDVQFTRIVQLPWFALLGFLAGALGAGFLWLLRQSETLFGRLRVPVYARLAFGGLIVGAIALRFPEVWGNGYGPTNQILHGHWELQFVAAVVVAKLLATLATVGSGAVGGVFTPTLFLGAGLGAGAGMLLHLGGYAANLPTAAFVLVGMGSLLAATTHSPLLAMILLFEISLDYTLMPPLMVACVISTLVARRFHRESIYTEPLRRRRVELDRESARLGAATQRTVGDLMRAPVPPLKSTASFREIADRFLASSYNFLPVVDDAGRLLGVVALQDLKQHLSTGQEISAVIAYDVMRPPPPCLTPDQTLLEAVPILLASEQRNVPVVTTRQENKLVGAVVRAEALGILSEAIAVLEATRE
jgi:CIC family chloride channel protein